MLSLVVDDEDARLSFPLVPILRTRDGAGSAADR